MNSTPRLALPFLSVGQAQKETFHNEALQILDTLTQPAVEMAPSNMPPTAPSVGSCYIVGDSGAAEWGGQEGCLAAWTSGGWRFTPPFEGMTAFVRPSQDWAVYRAGSWELGVLRGESLNIAGKQVVGSQASAISDPAGGGVVDAEARASVVAVLAALRQHGLIET